ncbi:MAG TPA: CPBP family intramembrane glutamic endopeptidase [Propionibacteriaceae bacterium]|nr:CPBP family intramembrane glutamic endopeptidase [Propionibacteriaceae bacterium]
MSDPRLPGPPPAPAMPYRFVPETWRPSAYPRVPASYPQFWRAPRWHWWKSLLTLGGLAVFFLVSSIVALGAAAAIDASTGRVPWSTFLDSVQKGVVSTTPAVFIANNLSLVALVPVCLLLARLVTGQRAGFLTSVVGFLRWGWLLRCIAMLAPFWIALVVFQFYAGGGVAGTPLKVTGDTLPLLLAVIFTTPLQSAGEEYAFRGVINRSVAGWIPNEALAVVAGGLVNSTFFMLAHGAGDPWLNVFYFAFGALSTFLTWRTGGLEASIAVHVVNNVTSEWSLPFTNISGLFDRQAGTAGPGILIQLALPVIAVALILWQARRGGIVRRSTPAPAGPEQPVLPGGWGR